MLSIANCPLPALIYGTVPRPQKVIIIQNPVPTINYTSGNYYAV